MMRLRDMKRLLPVLTIAGLAFFPPARADAPLEGGGEIRVEEATATPAEPSAYSSLRFRLVNDSTGTFHILGIETPLAPEARLVARIGNDAVTVLDSIGVPAGEELDLTTSHLRFEIGPLTRALSAGETVEITLLFVGGEFVVPVHVHAAAR